jgi:hypothetical protein
MNKLVFALLLIFSVLCLSQKISITNATPKPIIIKVYTVGRGFLIQSKLIMPKALVHFENLARVWYDTVVLDDNNKEVAATVLFCGSFDNQFNPQAIVIESNGIYALKQTNYKVGESVPLIKLVK